VVNKIDRSRRARRGPPPRAAALCVAVMAAMPQTQGAESAGETLRRPLREFKPWNAGADHLIYQ